MTVSLRITEDLDIVHALHAQAFPDVALVDDSHTFWLATREDKLVGFCSAIFYEGRGCVFLSRAAVMKSEWGVGLQRRMIRTRVVWARRLVGCDRVVTYCSPRNYPSMVNLLRCGFKFYEPTDESIEPYGVAGAHYFRLRLT